MDPAGTPASKGGNRPPGSGETGASRRRSPWFVRIAVTIALAAFVGWISGAAMRWDSTFVQPAGFGRGLLHGALMPLAWPTLLTGRDQTIYAPSNTGRTYKLGYSVGVNACGMIFFGWFFTRVRRWRKTPAAG